MLSIECFQCVRGETVHRYSTGLGRAQPFWFDHSPPVGRVFIRLEFPTEITVKTWPTWLRKAKSRLVIYGKTHASFNSIYSFCSIAAHGILRLVLIVQLFSSFLRACLDFLQTPLYCAKLTTYLSPHHNRIHPNMRIL